MYFYADNKVMKSHLLKKSIILILPFFLIMSLFAETSYKVKKGDTLYSISKKYQLTVAELRAANNLSEKDIIKAGQTLKIPDADISTAAALSASSTVKVSTPVKTKDYVVKKGDTLYGIALLNDTTVADLLAINNLDSKDVIYPGQKLKIGIQNDSNVKKSETNKEKTIIPPKAPDTRKYGEVLKYNSDIKWPVSNPTVTQVKGKISGVQLSAKSNENVICIHEGTVMFVGTYRGFGKVLFVQSKTGLIYAYTGLGSINVKKGEYVVSGNKVGTAGIDSITGKPQITLMVFQNGKPIDPAKAPRS